MLTREQARTKECPHRIGAYLKPNEDPPEAWFNCTANDCPKWVDCLEAGEFQCAKQMGCKKYASAMKREIHYPCNDCHRRYGRCGG